MFIFVPVTLITSGGIFVILQHNEIHMEVKCEQEKKDKFNKTFFVWRKAQRNLQLFDSFTNLLFGFNSLEDKFSMAAILYTSYSL